MTRNMRAEGAAVVDWFAQRSLVVTPAADSPTVLIVDEAEVAGVVIRRLWHTALTLVPALGIDVARSAADLAAGDALVYPDAALVRAASGQPTARIEIGAAQLLDEPAGLPGADDSPAWRALASTVNSILNGDHRLSIAAESALGHAIESLCAALIAGRPDATAAGFRSAQATFGAAIRLLTERAEDPAFTVEELADALQVSRQYLARVFARQGRTPSAALRARRLELADALAATGLPTPEIARRSGFPSARALLRAKRERDVRE